MADSKPALSTVSALNGPSTRVQAPLILVVGMHRSGTSLLAKLLQSLGVALPGDLIPGDIHNPSGYFESAAITDLQEQLLIQLGHWWPSEEGSQPLPKAWLQHPASQACRAALVDVLQRERKHQTGPWAIKDPRTSLLLPLWLRLARQLQLPLRLVLAIRHPAEVVQSLCHRDSETAGMTAARAERLWWRHNQAVLQQAGRTPLLVVDYSRWFESASQAAQQLHQLSRFCSLDPPDTATRQHCLTLIRPEHRRSDANAGQRQLNPRSLELYTAIRANRWQHAKRLKPWSWTQRLRGRRWQLAAEQARESTPDVGAWFDPEHYRGQWLGLAACSPEALLLHYRRAGWRSGSSPHPQFDLAFYSQSCEALGLPLNGNPLDHFLQEGQEHGLQPVPTDPGSWFDHDFYQRHCPGLVHSDRHSLLRHYRHVGAGLGLQPHPLFDPEHYQRQCHQAQVEPDPLLSPLDHWLLLGLELGLSSHPLVDASWLRQKSDAARGHAPIRLSDVHPWGALAERWCPNDTCASLERWLADQQITAAALQTLERQDPPVDASMATAQVNPDAAGTVGLAMLGGDWQDWRLHALLQHIPVTLPPNCRWLTTWPAAAETETCCSTVILNRLSLEQLNRERLLASLRRAVVFDADAKRVQQLRWLGVDARVFQLQHHQPSNPLSAQLASAASATWGLPPLKPSTTPAVLVLGEHGRLWEDHLDASLWCLPGFHQLRATTAEAAQQLAAWLNQAQVKGAQLAVLDRGPSSETLQAFQALQVPALPAPGWQPALMFQHELSPQELHQELHWRRRGCPPPPHCQTPHPSHHVLFERCNSAPQAAICISLHNYGTTISKALESCAAQTLKAIELIVVDDASNDAGASVVHHWMQQHQDRFSRVLLLQHHSNGGLAAARNTAFNAAQSTWCFVLDADNHLAPQALDHCLAVAEAADTDTAVVHPLVRLNYESVALDQKSLLSRQSWQRHLLTQGNYIDAMTLVRRSAWKQVGGFTHIEGGWEDFDFWCTLADAGFHGVLCPEVLAHYRVHASSMSSRSTRRLQRPLSRLLQHRHPWLRLALAEDGNPASEYG